MIQFKQHAHKLNIILGTIFMTGIIVSKTYAHEIANEDFAKALFSFWIGEKPFDKDLKQQVLGLNQSA